MKLSIAAAGCLAGLLVASTLASTVTPASFGGAARTAQGEPARSQAAVPAPGGAPASERVPARDASQQP